MSSDRLEWGIFTVNLPSLPLIIIFKEITDLVWPVDEKLIARLQEMCIFKIYVEISRHDKILQL